MNLQKCMAITLATQMSLGMAASPSIGVASARGAFRVNDAAVRGNGTLFSGARVETDAAPGEVALMSGQRVTLGVNSAAQVFSDHVVLERGESKLAGGTGSFGVEARNLRIMVEEAGVAGRVSMGVNGRILVASSSGKLQVSTASGIPLAAITAGHALEFDSRSSDSSSMRVTGRVNRQQGKLFLTDEATALTVELREGRVDRLTVEKNVGKRVEIAGLHVPNSVPIALQVQAVGAAQGANAGTGAGAGAGGTAGTGAGTAGAGASGAGAGAGGAAGAGAAGAAAGTAAAVSTTAIVAGVVVAGAAVGTVVGITKANDDPISH